MPHPLSAFMDISHQCGKFVIFVFLASYLKADFMVVVADTACAAVGNLPPKLKLAGVRIKLFGETAPRDYGEAICEAVVGRGQVMTWQLVNHDGQTYNWFVDKDDKILRKGYLGSIRLEKPEATWSESCGLTITSVLKYLNESFKGGATFTCYSYDISAHTEINSNYSRAALNASFDIFGGAVPAPPGDDTAGFDVIYLWIPYILAVIVGLTALLVSIAYFHKQNPFAYLYSTALFEVYKVVERRKKSRRKSATKIPVRSSMVLTNADGIES